MKAQSWMPNLTIFNQTKERNKQYRYKKIRGNKR